MAEKCALCGSPIERTFLEKVRGTYLRDARGKRRVVCSACQKTRTLEELRA